MIQSSLRIFRIPELRNRIFLTLTLLLACRLGTFISVPGINTELALTYFKSKLGIGQNLFQLVDVFSGGAFAQMTIAALGVMPYISASIIMQLMVAVMPSLQREVKENAEHGKRKLGRLTRMVTLALALFQSCLFARYALMMNLDFPGIVSSQITQVTLFGVPWLFYMTVMITMATGTLLLMWVGEQITEHGIGNGMSLIIAVNILSSIPSTLWRMIGQLNLDAQEAGQLSIITFILLIAIFVAVTMGVIQLSQGQRKIAIQYSRRMTGHGAMTQPIGSSFLPLKVNFANVIPVIFASTLLMFPATIGQFISRENFVSSIASSLSPGSPIHSVIYVILIIFFSFFWTATQFNPNQIASDMKKNGAFIAGVKQGKATQDYLSAAMNRITFIGAISLAVIAILPVLLSKWLGVDQGISHFFGGTSLLIMVGVILDTTKQVESHLMMKRYEGFIRKSRPRLHKS
jgi:preprotein translocase subunit SecY